MALVPITVAMLTPANVNYRVPDHHTTTDWAVGTFGNDIDTSDTSVTLNSAAPTSVPVYAPRTQFDKLSAGNLTPGTVMATDIGKDFGTYSGLFGRTGTIGPQDPYPNSLPVGP
jgi:hypothetical protein